VEEKERDREEQDKLGPLRRLTLSKSAPVMAAVTCETRERSSSESLDSNVHKSVSATPLSLLMKSPPPIKTEGLTPVLK